MGRHLGNFCLRWIARRDGTCPHCHSCQVNASPAQNKFVRESTASPKHSRAVPSGHVLHQNGDRHSCNFLERHAQLILILRENGFRWCLASGQRCNGGPSSSGWKSGMQGVMGPRTVMYWEPLVRQTGCGTKRQRHNQLDKFQA